MSIWAIMATCGRHHLAERSLKFFLDQHSVGKSGLLIYNNSDVEIKDVDVSAPHENVNSIVKLVNQHIDSQTGKRYTNLGAIYNDAIKHLPEDAKVIIHWDDDDIFLPNHINEGLNGLQRAIYEGKKAYKPAKSWYRHAGGVELMSNTLEPSIFVLADHIKEYGYSLTTTDQHLQWVNPLVYENQILVEDAGVPTLIYNWGDVNIPTFKTSGNAGSPGNFDNYRKFSQDHGDRILTPWDNINIHEYYNLVKQGNGS